MKRMLFLFISLVAPALVFSQTGKAPLLPELKWEPRSDWINVKTDVTPRAIGDGVADDTAALQAALNGLSEAPGQRNTVFIPAGTYRITKTLVVEHRDGISLLGSGRGTRIVWDGVGGDGDDSRMFWSNGAPRSRYIGIVWDGNNKASVGFDHDSKNYFETEIDHQHEAFINCTSTGLRVGHNQNLATAETNYENCLFVNCERGCAFLTFNDYDHTVSGCGFYQCGTGLYGGKGSNYYLRDSHFEGSRLLDIRNASEHGISVRRCTSLGSKKFFESASIAPVTIQDCRISAWTNPDGALSLHDDPTIIFDCVFTNPPSRRQPIAMANDQHVILSNNSSADTDGLVKPGSSKNITVIPAGKLGGSLHAPAQTFFTSTARTPLRIFDARVTFGAKGNGSTDDTAAVQAAIEAARQAGHGAMAYLPSGDYCISQTLHVSGADYSVGGSGTHSRLLWHGAKDGVLLHVDGPRNVTIENLDIGSAGKQANALDILQTDAGKPSSVRYRRVWVYGMYAKDPATKGLCCRNLGKDTVVIADHVTGNMHFTDAARATLLFNSSFEGTITVEGKAAQRDGLLAFQTRLGTINLFGLYVRDSQSIVMSDYYVEQADHLFDIRGNAGDPPGRITIQMPKDHMNINPVITLDNYHGQITLGPTMFYPGSIDPAQVVSSGSNPLTFIFMACQAYGDTPKFALEPTAKCVLLENTGKDMGPNVLPDGALLQVATALDDLRRLGKTELMLNYPWVTR